jgi:hypothetical protein
MNLVQLEQADGQRAVAVVDGDWLQVLAGVGSVRDLAIEAIELGRPLAERVEAHRGPHRLAYAAVIAEKRLLPPLDHPDPAHMVVTGTGLTHLGSAATRNAMHTADEATLTDSMKMFKMGLEGGRPAPGAIGVQPEWFYKGDGSSVVAPERDLVMPAFAEDGGEEPEIVGLYVIGPDGTPFRVGFALGNEFSDHVTEKHNYLWLAHSKLRVSSFGPELRLGELPGRVVGTSTIRREGTVLWQKPFESGEEAMSHTIANLEHHHFKYAGFRRPGDVHAHFFGTATLSVADGIRCRPGDVYEIEAEGFGRPLRNRLAQAADEGPVRVRQL